MKNSDKIIFVHNAHSGKANMLLDGVKKMTMGKKYPCKLCSLTYGPMKMKNDWKIFIESIEQPVEILYKNEFDTRYKDHPFQMPSVFLDNGKQLEVLISTEDFEIINDLHELIAIVRDKIV